LNRTVQGHTGSGILGDLLSFRGPETCIAMAPRDSAGQRRKLRRHFRDQRRALDACSQNRHADAVARHFFTSGLLFHGRTLGLYLANDGELDTAPLLSRLLKTRKRIALPVVARGGAMSFHRHRRGAALIINRYGILEPAPGAPFIAPLALDMLLMPLVAFDDSGARLGMGAGFYDRYLSRIPQRMRPLLVGLAHEVQRSPQPLPAAPWDIPLDGVITESGWQRFRAGRNRP
jgi:5-formyltetrahydrofolate cyclo-ligase